MESIGKDVPLTAPHFETRVGKRRWSERIMRESRKSDEALKRIQYPCITIVCRSACIVSCQTSDRIITFEQSSFII